MTNIILNEFISEDNLIDLTGGILYYYSRLTPNFELIKKYNRITEVNDNSHESYNILNALIESTLVIIRIEFEFFFKVELFKNEIVRLNKSLKNKNTKDDLFAEYYFDDPNHWSEIKLKNKN